MRVALVYGRSPSGHSSAAAALAEELRLSGHEVLLVNVSSAINPVLGPFLDRTYAWILKSCPWLWSAIYDRPFVLSIGLVFRNLHWRLSAGKILAKIRELEPDALVCTHAASLSVLALGKKRREIKTALAACPTDYGVHSFWVSGAVDLYLTPTAAAAERLAAAGINPKRIAAAGIPIDPAFGFFLEKAQARRELGLGPDGPVFVLSGGSRGLGRIKMAARILLGKFPTTQAAVLCGENLDLWCALKAETGLCPRLTPYQRADKALVRRLLSACDIFIGKAGGVTLAEAAAAGTAVVLLGVLPGQERRNADYWLGARAAVEVESPAELPAVVSRLLSNPDILQELRQNALSLGHPNAARDAAVAIEEFLAGPDERVTRAFSNPKS